MGNIPKGGYIGLTAITGGRLSGRPPFSWRIRHVFGAKRAAAFFSIPGDGEPPPPALSPMLGREGGHFIRQAMHIPQNHATWFHYDESDRFPTGEIDQYW